MEDKYNSFTLAAQKMNVVGSSAFSINDTASLNNLNEDKFSEKTKNEKYLNKNSINNMDKDNKK